MNQTELLEYSAQIFSLKPPYNKNQCIYRMASEFSNLLSYGKQNLETF